MTYQEALEALAKYPACIGPAIDALPSASPAERAALVRRIAVNIGDEATLRTALGIDPSEFAEFYPDMSRPELTTEDTIDSFINRFAADQVASLPQETIPAAPAMDYAAMMLDDDDNEITEGDVADSDDSTSSAIDSFLAAVPPKVPTRKPATEPTEKPTEKPVQKTSQDSALTLSLAKIMIKNGNYEKALEIITELNLNNSKKSIYFADQIRFLNKLIENKNKQI